MNHKPPYTITSTILELYGQIKESLGVCQSLMLTKPEARLRRQNRIKTIQSSLAIEGNTLGLEQVTALLDNQRIIGPAKDILEVENAIEVYERLDELEPSDMEDFLKAHHWLMKGLIDHAGAFRNSSVGIMRGNQVTHIAPGADMVPGLMKDLFSYVRTDEDLLIIKSCVFHYEIEFIHPFKDGNGRMGRLWQTRMLMTLNPIFAYVPIEKLIKDHQQEYYDALALSDNSGESTVFIEFMLDIINRTLKDTISAAKPLSPDYKKRTKTALAQLSGWFARKDYLDVCKGISTATASRDLKQLVTDGVLEQHGTGRISRYKKT